MKNTLDGVSDRLDTAREEISRTEDTPIENTQNETQKAKQDQKNEQSMSEL